MATAIIDANALVGLLDDQDKWHRTAIALRDALSEAGVELVYLDCVINETISVVARRTREQGRVDQLNAVLDQLMRLIPAKDITWASGEIRRLYPQIVELVRRSAGKLNFHDALIALLCKEQHVSALVSFDRDFDDLDWLMRVDQTTQVATLSGVE